MSHLGDKMWWDSVKDSWRTCDPDGSLTLELRHIVKDDDFGTLEEEVVAPAPTWRLPPGRVACVDVGLKNGVIPRGAVVIIVSVLPHLEILHATRFAPTSTEVDKPFLLYVRNVGVRECPLHFGQGLARMKLTKPSAIPLT